ncbi:MAG: hypothetical protein Q7P63_01730, partial [Verrucomicrobiota bacterium JB022]|nr:hypothetical protein [Verrucomicrobiota bacterium JB022]
MTSSVTFRHWVLSAFALFTSAAPLAAYDALALGEVADVPMDLRKPRYPNIQEVFGPGLALSKQGELFAWGGWAQDTQLLGLPVIENVAAYAGNSGQHLVLLKNGNVMAIKTDSNGYFLDPIIEGENVVEIAVGHPRGVAVREDGSVITFSTDQHTTPPQLEVSPVQTLAINENEVALLLLKDGTLKSFDLKTGLEVAAFEDVSGIIAIAAGESDFIALRADGTVVSDDEAVPPNLQNVVAIGAADGNPSEHFYTLNSDGTLDVWGNGAEESALYGLTDVTALWGGTAMLSNGTAVTAYAENGGTTIDLPFYVTDVRDIQASEDWNGTTLAVMMDGTVRAWGNNSHREADVPEGLADIVQVAVGTNHSVALDASGTLYGWGDNSKQQLDFPTTRGAAVFISAGGDVTTITYADGTVAELGSDVEGASILPEGLQNVKKAATNGLYSIALHDDGTLSTWSEHPRTPPYQLGTVKDVGVAQGQAWALTESGEFYAWNVVFDPNAYQPGVDDGFANGSYDFTLPAFTKEILTMDLAGYNDLPAPLVVFVDGTTEPLHSYNYFGFFAPSDLPSIRHLSAARDVAYLFIDADSDADLLPDDWELLYFGDLSQTAEADFDGDGHSNRFEQLLGLDPTEADSRLRTTVEQGYVVFGPISPDAGLDYQLVSSDAWGDFVL